METIQEIIKKYFYLDFENGKPTAYIFTDKQFCEEYQDFMKHRKILVKMVEIKKEQRMLMFGELFRSGFEQLMINNGQNPLVISLFDMIEKMY